MNHRETIELLPWYANESLQPDERQRVAEHLVTCDECARELADILRLQESVTASDPTPEPSPFQFTRALARVEEYERQRDSRNWRPSRFMAWAMAAQFVVIIALGVLLLTRESSTTTTATNPSEGLRIVVGFQPGVTEETVRLVVQEMKGTITSGPSALGLYTIQIPSQPPESLQKLLETLRRYDAVIRVALPAS